MSDEQGTALEKREDTGQEQTFSELVRSGANLQPEEWNQARIAAARKTLPEGFRSPTHMIAYLARAQRSGLDPFAGELWAWEDERGELTFMTSRDGFLKILRRDPQVEGVEVGAVFEKDKFRFTKDGDGNVTVEHTGGIERGRLKGAYCCIHREDQPDHIEIRLLEDFKHLMGKNNWKKYPIDMIEARCVSAAARIATTSAAGIYAQADFELTEGGQRTGQMVKDETEASTDELARKLRGEQAGDDEGGSYTEPIEAEATEEDDQGHDVADDREGDMVRGTPDAPNEKPPEEEPAVEEGGEIEDRELSCPICGSTDFETPNALSGHKSGHTKRGEKLPDGFTLDHDAGAEEECELVNPAGGSEGLFDGWQEAVSYAQAAVAGGEPSEPVPETSDAPPADLEGTIAEVEEELAHKSRGQLMVAAYGEIEPLDDEEGHDLLKKAAAEITGDPPEEVALQELEPGDLLELIGRARFAVRERTNQ